MEIIFSGINILSSYMDMNSLSSLKFTVLMEEVGSLSGQSNNFDIKNWKEDSSKIKFKEAFGLGTY